ncbi:F-box/kelch-repeat protein At3g06240-like [Hibiscus syriacus]|uniref:F-box/kelch-repeat protein At3g06240-like n=1 Tax=Hibiscus syriacus TaxID=106335 RepID=UPI0019229F4A|nr:F-box/kelch-repeat protein At3g06240-like [Hibiscus syriacus]
MQLNQSIESKRGRCVMDISQSIESETDICVLRPRRFELDYGRLFSGNEVKLVEVDSSFGLKIIDNGWTMHVWDSCNGLLCVYVYPRNIALVNPSTRQNNIILCSHGPKNKPKPQPLLGGFGYDALHDDHKVVVIIDRTMVEVYSLKYCAWSPIGDFPHDAEIIGGGVHVNGVIHWITLYGSESVVSITAFDLSNQEFSRITTPIHQDDYVWLHLLSLGGNLCIGYNHETSYEFLVMEIHGKENSWKRTVLKFIYRSMPFVLDFPRSEEALIISNGCLFIYNHRDKTHRRVNYAERSLLWFFIRGEPSFSLDVRTFVL